jgi:hypothetical protein
MRRLVRPANASECPAVERQATAGVSAGRAGAAPLPNRAPSSETDSENRFLTANADKLLMLADAAK